MRTVVFDLDGTLADTSGDLIAAANACFQDLGYGDLLDPARDQGTALRGGRAMLRLGFQRLGTGEDLIDGQYPHLLEHYRQAIAVHSKMYPGAVEAVEKLRRDGYKVAICTNKPEALAEDLMSELGVRDLFHALLGADSLPVRKPDPTHHIETVLRAGGSVERSLLVGDTKTDIDTSRAAGVPSVLVTFGPGDEAVKDLKPDAFLSSYNDLSSIVTRLIG